MNVPTDEATLPPDEKAMLHALGFPDERMPRLVVHGWWNVKGAKMSKSTGNVIDPVELSDTREWRAVLLHVRRIVRRSAYRNRSGY